MLKTYDIFLIDADGTLFDFDKAEADALAKVFGLYGIYTLDVLLTYRRISFGLWASFEKGEITATELQTQRFGRLFEEFGIRGDAGEFNNKYLNEISKGYYLIDGALELCRDLTARGKKIYIVTNGLAFTQTARLAGSAIKDYVSGIFISELIGFQKPHVAFFEHVLEYICFDGKPVDKNRILVVGDSLSADIKGADNMGFDSCWVNIKKTLNNMGDAMPTYEVNCLLDVLLIPGVCGSQAATT